MEIIFRIVGVLGGAERPVGDHQRQVEPADPAVVRAQQPVQVGGRPQRLAPLTGIGTGPQRTHGPFGVADQAGQDALGVGEPCGRGLPDLPRLLHPVP
ncbi:hypothetical protein ACH4EC_37795 [Streptomyces anulatus]